MEEQQETLVRLGEEAEVLLDSQAFSSTVNNLVDTSFQTSRTRLRTRRERCYAHYRALVDIVDATPARRCEDEIVSKSADADDNNQTEGA